MQSDTVRSLLDAAKTLADQCIDGKTASGLDIKADDIERLAKSAEHFAQAALSAADAERGSEEEEEESEEEEEEQESEGRSGIVGKVVLD